MREKQMELDAAIDQALSYPLCFVRGWSRVYLGPISDLPEELKSTKENPKPAEWIEARFFGKKPVSELRFYHQADYAILIEVDESDETITRTFPIEMRQFGTTLEKADVLSYDEDGQVSVAATLLTGWEGGTPK